MNVKKKRKLSESESDTLNSKSTKKKKESLVDPKWSLSEKQRFINGLNQMKFRKKDGKISWTSLASFIGTRTTTEVKYFAKYFNSLENGKVYDEFNSKAAIDVWKHLAENSTIPGDNAANESVPQVFTVAALEPMSSTSCVNSPNYSNIYNYLSAVLRGETCVPKLPADDAVVILELLEDLIYTLSNSETLIQRDFMHSRYNELRKNLLSDESMEDADCKRFGSTNPFGIPFEVLEFKEVANSPDK